MKKNVKKPLIIALVVLLAAALAFYWYYTKKQADSAASAGTGYTLGEVAQGDIAIVVDANSSISPGDTASVKAKVKGTVDSILVAEGQLVAKGDTLLTLDGQTGADEIQLAQINLDIEKRNLTDLLKDRANLKITAPVAGVVGALTVEAGDELQANATFASITDRSQMEATCALNRSQIKLVKKGDPATGSHPGSDGQRHWQGGESGHVGQRRERWLCPL